MQASARLIYGALVADAASLGLHWIYDPARLAEIAERGDVVFLEPDAANYEGCKGSFVHELKRAGALSGYGEYCALMLRHLAGREGRFSRVGYQTLFRRYFGPGGAYVGYVDRPTRLTIQKLLPFEDPASYPQPSGVKDDQLPALAALPAVVACAHCQGRDRDALLDEIEHVVRVTSDDAAAVQAARVAGVVLFELLAHTSLEGALQCGIEQASGALAGRLLAAISEPVFDTVAAAERFGAACHVEQGLPVIFHILANRPSYPEAVRANILAGGDSCGRSIMLGAAMGVIDVVPMSWAAKLQVIEECSGWIAALGLGDALE
ncbi:MAG: ADP-ribosylglycohydrolase family protein [Zoogloeaceae bacterium]|nr:ADP-ribosylglycohydrolase family protein [Zoogloeaceae bacterium]